jgi:hypothetical protein
MKFMIGFLSCSLSLSFRERAGVRALGLCIGVALGWVACVLEAVGREFAPAGDSLSFASPK